MTRPFPGFSLFAILIAALVGATAGRAGATLGSPDRVIIDFKDGDGALGFRTQMEPQRMPDGTPQGRLVPPPPRPFTVFFSATGGVLLRGDKWELMPAEAGVYHLRSLQWKDFFWSVDAGGSKAYRVTQGQFGRSGGRKTPLRGVSVMAPLPPNRKIPDIVYLKFASSSFTFDPPSGRGRLVANGEDLETFEAGEWSWTQTAPTVFKLRHPAMRDWSWMIDAVGPRVETVPEPDRRPSRLVPGPSLAGVRIVTVPGGAEDREGIEQDVMANKLAGKPLVRSEWIESEKNLHRAILKASPPCDVFVVPFQVQGYAIDRPGRSLMTRYLSARIARTAQVKVANPTLVARALGESARRISEEEVRAVAEDLKARVIVQGYAGHWLDEKMRLTIVIRQRTGDKIYGREWKTTVEEWRDIPFNDERPPEEAFRAILDNVVAKVPVPAAKADRPRKYGKEKSVPVPESIREMIASPASSPVVLAFRLQALGMLFPDQGPEQERLFERSLVALDAVDPRSSDFPLLKARAQFHLHRRPAAVAALDRPKTPEEHALSALLEGDLPTLAKRVREIKSPLPRLIAELELDDLRRAYDPDRGSPETVPDVVQDRSEWVPVVIRRLEQADYWNVQSNLLVKERLDRSFPLPGYKAETVARGVALLGDRSREAELSAAIHRKRALEKSGHELFPPDEAARPVPGDELDLLAQTAEANLMKEVRRTALVQWIPDEGLATLDRYEIVYRGHPGMAALRAEILADVAARKAVSTPEQYRDRAREHAVNAFAWSGGQTRAAFNSRLVVRQINDYRTDSAQLGLYDGDYPGREFWPSAGDRKSFGIAAPTGKNAPSIEGATKGLSDLNRRNLLYTTTGFAHFKSCYESVLKNGGDEAADRFLRANSRRFVGHPDRAALLVEAEVRRGNERGAVAIYEQAIADSPDSWRPYRDLATYHVERAEFGKAAGVFRRYPLFMSRDGSQGVLRSNLAIFAGQDLYWRGAVEESLPFLRMAAESGTGSSAEMSAATRLSLLDGDYRRAASHALERARRYNKPDAWRDVFVLLHATGNSRQAWQLFDSALAASNSPEVWTGAMTGLRIEGKTGAEIIEWLSREPTRKAAGHRAGEIALAALLVDRTADPALAERIAALEPAAPVVSIPGYKPPWKLTAGGFARAYHALRNGKPGEAFDLFGGPAGFNNATPSMGAAAAPYVFLGAALSGRMDGTEKELAKLKEKQPFTYHLAQAYIHGTMADHAGAVANLKSANARIPYGQERFIPAWYQLVEACEWLHRTTGRGEYKTLALQWAKTHQRIDPAQAWAYGVEARLGDEAGGRIRAIGLTLYLDPNSEHLAGVSDREKEKAREWLKSNNPFKKEKGEEPTLDI